MTKIIESYNKILKSKGYVQITSDELHLSSQIEYKLRNYNRHSNKMKSVKLDLPSNLLKIHKKRYGNYGLSLSKEWGIKNGINPVMYVSDKNAQVMNYYRNIQQFILNKNFTDFIDAHKDAYGKQAEEIMSEYFYNVLCMSAFLRRYEDENTRFYDEREWRYLFIDGKTSFIQQIYFTDQKNFDLQKRNLELQKNPLLFDVADIRNIFVTTKDEKDDLLQKLLATKKFSGKEKQFEELIVIGDGAK